MVTKFLGAASLAALTMAAAPALSATLIIDDFTGFQVVTNAPSEGFVDNSQVADAGVLGGFRDLQAMNTGSDGSNINATDLRVDAGLLKFSNNDGAKGFGIITYDGDDDPTVLTTNGLGGINFNIGANPRFVFDVERFDLDVAVRISLFDTMGREATYDETLETGFNPILTFGELDVEEGFDFTQIGALQLFVDSTNTFISVDGALRSVRIEADDMTPVIPLPASGLLLLGGLGLIPAVRRMRRKA